MKECASIVLLSSNCARLVQAIIGQWLATSCCISIVHKVCSNYEMVNHYMYVVTFPQNLVHNANLWVGASSSTLPSSLLISPL